MPSRPSLHFGTSTSPHQSSHTVNEVVSAIHRKLSVTHVEPVPAASSAPRRPSFSMDSLLHPNKKDRRSDGAGASDGDHGRKDKRASLALRGSHKTRERSSGQSPRLAPVRPAKLAIIIESPPLCFYGGSQSSTGALLSGRLKLNVEDPAGQITLEKFTMVLRLVISTKKPISKDCHDCKERYEEINSWNFLTEPKTFRTDDDSQLPFSYLLKGALPASTVSHLGSLTYQLKAKATTTEGETIEIIHPLTVIRAISQGPDKSSIRIFPPTNLTGRVVLPPVIHPIGVFNVQLTLSGVVEKKKDSETRWRLRKMMWRIEEHTTMISVPCSKHTGKLGDGKGIQNAETKTIGNAEMKSGWKTDFDTIGGEIYLEFPASMSAKPGQRSVCDVNSEAGLEVKHNLVVELIVAEEFCPNKNANVITPTGAARILRMQFNLQVTERSGLGISWDEEMPPMYEDVPDSPPGYGSADRNDGAFGGAIIEDYDGPELEYTDLERMTSENPNDPPRYREREPADVNAGLPMRARVEAESAAAGPSRLVPAGQDVHRSRTGPVLSEDDFGIEPPQYAMRQRTLSDSAEQRSDEDYGVGEAV